MIKSIERVALEKKIQQAHDEAFEICAGMINKEFGGDEKVALQDNNFIDRMHAEVKHLWKKYLKGHKKLGDLEKKEGFPAMHAYAALLDSIKNVLPLENRVRCYYPFSGIDFYWARIFERVVFEDICFDQPQKREVYLSTEHYTRGGRKRIVEILRREKIIPNASELEFLISNAEEERDDDNFNNQNFTLCIKGWGSLLDFLQKRFKEKPVFFGAIISVNSYEDSFRDVEKTLARHSYKFEFFHPGDDFLVPFAISSPKNIHIFIKKQGFR